MGNVATIGLDIQVHGVDAASEVVVRPPHRVKNASSHGSPMNINNLGARERGAVLKAAKPAAQLAIQIFGDGTSLATPTLSRRSPLQ